MKHSGSCASGGRSCRRSGYVEFCGYCPACWRSLSAEARATLLECRAPPPNPGERHDHHHTHTHHHPPLSLPRAAGVAVVAGMAGAAAFAALAAFAVPAARAWLGW